MPSIYKRSYVKTQMILSPDLDITSPEIKKYINLIYFNNTPISPTAVTALLFISVTGSSLK